MSDLWPLCPLTSISRHSPPLAHTLVPDLHLYSGATHHAPVVPFSEPQPILQQKSSPSVQSKNSHTFTSHSPKYETAKTSRSSQRSSYHTASPLQGKIQHIGNDVMEEVDLPSTPRYQHSRSPSPSPTRKSLLPVRTLSYTCLHPSLLTAIQVLSNDASTQTDDADLPGNDAQCVIERAGKTATALGESPSDGIPIIRLGDIRSTCSDSLYRFPTPICRRRGYGSLRVTIPPQSSYSSSSQISLVSEEFFRLRQEPCLLCGRSSPRGTEETLSGISSLSERHMGRKTKGLRGWWGRARGVFRGRRGCRWMV